MSLDITSRTCAIEPFRYQSTPQPGAEDGASGNQINEQYLEDYLTRLRTAICEDLQEIIDSGGGGGATTFLELTDTPDTYVGQAQKLVRVNAGETGLEFSTPPTPPAPGGPDTAVQFNDGGAFGGETPFVYVKGTNQLTPGDSQLLIEQASAPATPAAGNVVAFASGRMAITLPSWLNEDGTLNFVQTSFGKRHIFEASQWTRAGNAAAADVQWRGGGTFAGVGASTTQPARATTNIHTRIPGITRLTSTTTNSSQATYYGTYLFAAPAQGYFFSVRFAVNATPTTLKMLFGLTATTAAPAGTDTPSNSLNFIGIGCDAAETTLRILNNDGAGTCTVTDLGANFPSRDTSTAYDVFIYLHPGGGSFDYFVVNLGTGDTASGTISSNLPSTAVFQCPILWMSNGATAGGVAAQLDFARVYMEVFDGV